VSLDQLESVARNQKPRSRGIATGSVCDAFNGLLVARVGLPSIVVAIGTMSLFRGISFITLGDQAYKGYPESFSFFDKDTPGGWFPSSLGF
jgi:ribose/xylose/arabinose/galactoside ABC-type transport system permease subunit